MAIRDYAEFVSLSSSLDNHDDAFVGFMRARRH
jgi:hypothetical protein